MYTEKNDTKIFGEALDLLTAEWRSLTTDEVGRLGRYVSLIVECNAMYGLVSRQEVNKLFSNHVVDALSLAPLIAASPEGPLLDLGSGAGFPAIPLKIVFPELELVLVERSAKKVGFLRRLIGPLGLEGVTILHGEFPMVSRGMGAPRWITARAIERPGTLLGALDEAMREETEFLCQWALDDETLGALFHVEQVSDSWGAAELRRGRLRVATKKR
jgi:16S rRNA (guanine(527)-N(7))-methyltransferase RsmG